MRTYSLATALLVLFAAAGCGDTPRRTPDGSVDGAVDSGAGADAGVCGDGTLGGLEVCDDGNDVAGDGCDACAMEAGYVCTGEPSVCTPDASAGCGDGLRGPSEECDDGNRTPGDGCGADCRLEGCVDADMDGFTDRACGGLDCDDSDAATNPDAVEICGNSVDENCDGTVQPIVDMDHDGSFCTIDCDDTDPAVATTNAEVCGNGIDDDCDPATPDLFDMDMDGLSCDMDCDDMNAAVPGAVEVCGNGIDDDCDASTPDLFDADMDGVMCDADCDDGDVSVGATPGGCSFRYFEDFEAGDGGWVAGGTSSSWAYGTPTGPFIMAAASGTKAWATNLSGDYNTSERSTLTSPALDLSAVPDDPILRFSLIYKTELSHDWSWVELSTDGGATFARVEPAAAATGWYASGERFRGTSGDAGQWTHVRTTLVGAHGHGDVRVRFVFESDGSVQYDGFGIDDVLVAAPYENLTALALMGPGSVCGLTSVESVALEVRNDGTNAIDRFDVSLIVDGAAPVTEAVTHTLAPGDSYLHTFSAMVDLSAIGAHSLVGSVSAMGDADPSDDTAMLDLTHVQTISAGAVLDFEADGAGFTVEGTNPSWAWGVPSGTFIPAAASGTHAWVTNPAGDYNASETSYLVSPCIDLTASASDPVLTFSHIRELESFDEGWVEVSIDGGTTWTKLGASGEGSNWYNDTSNQWWDSSTTSGTWQLAYHTLTGTAGEANVRVRFNLRTDSSVQKEGFGVDDFGLVTSVVDVAVNSVSTSSRCGLGATETVRVVVQNNGSGSLGSMPVDVQVDSGAPVREVIAGPIAPGGTAARTLMTTVDLSTSGPHTVRVTAVMAGDISPGNNAAEQTVSNAPTFTLPFSTDFESDAASFTVTGTNSSWAWGVPTGPVISSAVSGTHAWVTNLSGDYNTNETSYLTTPCFDASTSPSLFLRFKHMYELQSLDEGWVEVSTDGGVTWAKLGASGAVGGWYNDTRNDWWDGGSPSMSGDPWHDAFIDVSAYAGLAGANLRFRFILRSNSSIQHDGFGIDDLSIAP